MATSESSPSREVLDWLHERAHPIDDSTASVIEPLQDRAERAVVVGLGESTRGARTSSELTRIRHQIVQELVSEAGFRTIAIEDGAAATQRLNAYVRGGTGDARAALAGAWMPSRTVEFAELVDWIRAFNAAGATDQQVAFIGVGDDGEQRAATDLVEAGTSNGGGAVYLGGLAHTAAIEPGTGNLRAMAGRYAREAIGDRYLSVGLTFHHSDGPEIVPAPDPSFLEFALGKVTHPAYLLDLRSPHPSAVAAWLDRPTRVRVIGPRYEPSDARAYAITGRPGVLFDAVVHQQVTMPVMYLDAS